MKRMTCFILTIITFWSCQKEINVYVKKKSGSIAGRVLPLNVGASVELYQGQLIQFDSVDENGYFIFQDVSPGTYVLRAKADNFGTTERSNIHVSDGEGYDVGTIELSQYPYPLKFVSPFNGAMDVSNYYHMAKISLTFYKEMDISSVEAAFHIVPDVEDLTFIYPRQKGYDYQIEGNFKFGTQYTFTLDTTATSLWGETLEFPYSSTFTTEYFKVTRFISYYFSSTDSYYTILFDFNSFIGTVSFEDYLTIDPETDVPVTYPYSRSSGVRVEPSLSWRPDTTYIFTISKDLPEIEGTTLGADTSFSLTIPPLQVVDTNPYSNQHFVPVGSTVRIQMNNLLDEGSIPNSVTFSPFTDFQVSTQASQGVSTFILAPDSLIADTSYVVTIDTTLKDFYGGNLRESYSFSFVTD